MNRMADSTTPASRHEGASSAASENRPPGAGPSAPSWTERILNLLPTASQYEKLIDRLLLAGLLLTLAIALYIFATAG